MLAMWYSVSSRRDGTDRLAERSVCQETGLRDYDMFRERKNLEAEKNVLMKSYDYAHRQGVRALTWDDFVQLCGGLAEKLMQERVELVVGIARAGLLPATLITCSLRCEMYPVRVTRRVQDDVLFATPVWRVPLSADVAGKVVVVIDEIADTGETLALVAEQARALGASRVITATLVSHSWVQPAPDFCGLVSDELVIFPWDQRVLVNGEWQLHPELVSALEAQGKGQDELDG